MCSNYVSFKLPNEIWESTNLNIMEKLFLSKIYQLDKDDCCYAGNKYFAEFFNLKNTRVSQIINSLVKKNFISAKYERANQKVVKRVLTIKCMNPFNKVYEVLTQKCKENTKVNRRPNTKYISGRSKSYNNHEGY